MSEPFDAPPTSDARDAALQCLLDALRAAQDAVRTFDTKAQIMGIMFILSVNVILTVLDIGPTGTAPSPLWILLALALLVIGPVVLFAIVLYPGQNPTEGIAFDRSSVCGTYFVARGKGNDLDGFLGDVGRTDWHREIAFELLKISNLRDIKRQRFLRALTAAGVSYGLIALLLVLATLRSG
jgi:hypothetical protein